MAHFLADAPTDRGIILIPPLIGGSYILFGRSFTDLVRAGYRVVSFNYRGHSPSDGRFTLGASCDDVVAIARHLRETHPGVPVSAVGICSGSLPVFESFDREPDLFDRVVFVNAIHHLQQAAPTVRALQIYLRARGLRPPASFGQAMSIVLDGVFPEIEKDDESFGLLKYDDMEKWTFVRDYLWRPEWKRQSIVSTPALCCYGSSDRMLGLSDPRAEQAYRSSFQRRFADVKFEPFESDHYMTGLRTHVAGAVREFLQTAAGSRSRPALSRQD